MLATDEWRTVLTLRLTQFFDYQTWRVSGFLTVSPTDGDWFAQPEASYKVSDSFSVRLGANLFGGARETTFFGQLDRNDNVYSGVRYYF
ncbi:MAG: hypothetical protein HY303_10215 [Candidatus Wallbacteria bacterium]|nr:hypothetical protein [Candidatus Wallbacteria bacterium]